MSIVHLRQLDLLQRSMPDYIFVPLMYRGVFRFPEKFREYKARAKFVQKDGLFESSIWKLRPELVLMRHALPTSWRLQLVWEAKKRDVPVIAFEEVNQLTLNGNNMNNYLIPTDELWVPSSYEKKSFEKLGYETERIKTVGWPFFNLKTTDRVIEGDNVLVSLGILSRHHQLCLETMADNIKMLKIVDRGLPKKLRLIIKPHPAEKKAVTRQMVDEAIQNRPVVIAQPTRPFEELIVKARLLVNRGLSQTVLEALAINVPVAIVPLGFETVFENQLSEVVVTGEEDLAELWKKYQSEKVDFGKFVKTHVPVKGKVGLAGLIKRIRNVSSSNWSEDNYRGLVICSAYSGNKELLEKYAGGIDVTAGSRYISNSVWRMMWAGFLIKQYWRKRGRVSKKILKHLEKSVKEELLPLYFLNLKVDLVKLSWRERDWQLATKWFFALMKRVGWGQTVKLLWSGARED